MITTADKRGPAAGRTVPPYRASLPGRSLTVRVKAEDRARFDALMATLPHVFYAGKSTADPYGPLNAPEIQNARRNSRSDQTLVMASRLLRDAFGPQADVALENRPDAPGGKSPVKGNYLMVSGVPGRDIEGLYWRFRGQHKHHLVAMWHGTVLMKLHEDGNIWTDWTKHVCAEAALSGSNLPYPPGEEIGGENLARYWANCYGQNVGEVRDMTILDVESLRFLVDQTGYKNEPWTKTYVPSRNAGPKARPYEIAMRVPRIVDDVEEGVTGSDSFVLRPHLLQWQYRELLVSGDKYPLVVASSFEPGIVRHLQNRGLLGHG